MLILIHFTELFTTVLISSQIWSVTMIHYILAKAKIKYRFVSCNPINPLKSAWLNFFFTCWPYREKDFVLFFSKILTLKVCTIQHVKNICKKREKIPTGQPNFWKKQLLHETKMFLRVTQAYMYMYFKSELYS